MNAKEILKEASCRLILRDCFWASLVLQMPHREDRTAPTAWTDGEVIGYNPDYVSALYRADPDYVVSLEAHEVGHLMMMHHVRKPPGANHEKWNRACDYALHCVLSEVGFKIHPNWLYSPLYNGMSAEEIYPRLPEVKSFPGPPCGPGEVRGAVGTGGEKTSRNQKRRAEMDWNVKVGCAAMAAQKQGWQAGILKKYLPDISPSKTDWRTLLASFLKDCLPGATTWSRPCDRYIYRGLYLPSVSNVRTGRFVILMDSSGSVGDDDMQMFASEVHAIAAVHNAEIIVVWADAEVHGSQRFQPYEAVKLIRMGCGGTDYRPGFTWVEDQRISPSGLIYLTDGWCNSFPEFEPGYPVLWVIAGGTPNNEFSPPWGKVVMI